MKGPFTSDPSPLTTQALLREIESLKELAFTRVDAVEKAVQIAHDDLVRVPTDVQKAVGTLDAIVAERFNTVHEKFSNIGTRFQERDIRNEQTRNDTRTAVDATFAAQKEASRQQTESFSQSVAKSEAATAKQIDQLGALLQQSIKANDEKIGDIKDRLVRIEGTGKGRADVWAWLIAAAAVLVSVGVAVLK